MTELEIGQRIYVTRKQLFHETKPNLHPYVIVRFNSSSIYATPLQSDYEQRFDRKTLEGKMSVGDRYTAFFTEEEYWSKIEQVKEHKELKSELKELVDSLTVEQLRKLKAYLNKQ